ncbi:Uma2 family endonuclease [Frankia nepalensis]|nr:Uma2 family endonuclease [Frankia nepalensis]
MLPAPPVTVAALDAADADDGRVELLDGLCVLRPWPTPLRTRVTQRLAERLATAAPSGAHVYPHGVSVQVSARTLLAPDIVVGPAPGRAAPPASGGQPAAASHSPAPVSSAPAATTSRVGELPFLVVEVADENTRRYDRTLKLDVYRERGVPSCWLVDPDPAAATAVVEVYDLHDGAYVRTARVVGSETLTVTRPFPVTVVPADLIDPPE